MKLVHISDLHAGKTLGNISRNEDLLYALDQIISFSKENRVNTVLVAGDIFDKANPDNLSKQLIFEDFFLRLNSLNINTIVIAGNHDSYDFFKSIKELSKLARVHIFDRPNPDSFTIDLDHVTIVALPYPSERVITEASERANISYAEKVEKFINYMDKKTEDRKIKILLAHLMIAGAVCTHTEREVHISDYYAVPPSAIPTSFTYVALGHVHKFQRIDKAPVPTYYSGTLYQIDFSEAGQEKYFNFIEIDKEGIKHLETVKIDIKNPLINIEVDQDEVLKKLPELKRLSGYIKLIVNVKNKKTVPYIVDRIKEEIGEKLPRGVELRSEYDTRKAHSLENINLTPLGLYKEYYKKEYGEEMPEDIERAFITLLEETYETPSP